MMLIGGYLIFSIGLAAYLGYAAGYNNALEDIERVKVKRE